MKIRADYVSNSSSFIVRDSNDVKMFYTRNASR